MKYQRLMNEQELIDRIERATEASRSDPEAFKRKALWFTLIFGYGFFVVVVFLLLGLVGGMLALLILSPKVFLILFFKKFGFLLLLPLWAGVKALFVSFPEPEGFEVSPKHGSLHDVLRGFTEKLDLPKIHKILITDDLNASAVQTRRFGLFGPVKNILVLGLPLMLLMSPEQVKSVMAHELGHFSGNHSRLAGWMYRARRTWAFLQHSFEEQDNWLAAPVSAYLKWFHPRFETYAFVISRDNEYEADNMAVALTSQAITADALVFVHAVAGQAYQAFWGDLMAKNRDSAQFVDNPWSQLHQSFECYLQSHKEQMKEAYDAAMSEKTTYHDTHPALKDRLANIGHVPSGIYFHQTDALSQFFGSVAPKILGHFNNDWVSYAKEQWQQNYEAAQEHRATIHELEPNQQKTSKQWMDLGWAYSGLDEKSQAADCLQRAYAGYQKDERHGIQTSDFANIVYWLGWHHHQQGASTAEVQSWMEQTQVDAFVALDAYRDMMGILERDGSVEDRQAWAKASEPIFEKAQKLHAQMVQFRQEDVLRPLHAANTLLASIKTLLQQHGVKRAYMAEKMVEYPLDKPFLAIAVSWPWYHFNQRFNELEHALGEHLEHMLVVVSKQEHSNLYKQVKKHGERLL